MNHVSLLHRAVEVSDSISTQLLNLSSLDDQSEDEESNNAGVFDQGEFCPNPSMSQDINEQHSADTQTAFLVNFRR